MSDSEKDTEPSSVSSVPPLFSDDADTLEPGSSVYKYRDFSHVTDDDIEVDDTPSAPSSRGNSESSIRVQKFPVKLYAILAQKEFNEIVTWMPHGRSWKVLKPGLFESLVMPLFFEYSNYHSFNRLVNAWSFRRISSGPDRGSYYHELFLRGLPHLQKYMRRLPKTHRKLPMKKKDEPDFYALDKSNPLPPLEAAPVPGAAATSMAMQRSKQQGDHHPNFHHPHHLAHHQQMPPSLQTAAGANAVHSHSTTPIDDLGPNAAIVTPTHANSGGIRSMRPHMAAAARYNGMFPPPEAVASQQDDYGDLGPGGMGGGVGGGGNGYGQFMRRPVPVRMMPMRNPMAAAAAMRQLPPVSMDQMGGAGDIGQDLFPHYGGGGAGGAGGPQTQMSMNHRAMGMQAFERGLGGGGNAVGGGGGGSSGMGMSQQQQQHDDFSLSPQRRRSLSRPQG